MLPDSQETIVALSSATGPGARAIVRLSGPGALAAARTLFVATTAIQNSRARYTGTLRLPGVHSALPADLYYWPGPGSYTGQDLVELHLVSSAPLIELTISTLLTAGCRAARPGEFTMRAFLAGKMDLTRAEAV